MVGDARWLQGVTYGVGSATILKILKPEFTMRLRLVAVLTLVGLAACTQESQNQIGRSIQNWTGTDGTLEIYAGDKLVRRFIHIDKLSTAYGTEDSTARPYRFGYGVLDANLDGAKNEGEKRVYFEFSDYASNYVFFESPR